MCSILLSFDHKVEFRTDRWSIPDPLNNPHPFWVHSLAAAALSRQSLPASWRQWQQNNGSSLQSEKVEKFWFQIIPYFPRSLSKWLRKSDLFQLKQISINRPYPRRKVFSLYYVLEKISESFDRFLIYHHAASQERACTFRWAQSTGFQTRLSAIPVLDVITQSGIVKLTHDFLYREFMIKYRREMVCKSPIEWSCITPF